MFDRLVASRYRHTDRTGVPSSTVAVLTHAGVCAAAVLGTLRPHRVSKAEGPPIIISWPQPREDRSHADPLGRAEPRSLVLESSYAGFETAARAYVLGAVFRPGRTHGRAVRVLLRLPIGFTLRPTR